MDPEPEIRCLLVLPLPDGECRVGKLGLMLRNGEREVLSGIVSRQHADDHAKPHGFIVFEDPTDRAVWNEWHRRQQPKPPRKSWNTW